MQRVGITGHVALPADLVGRLRAALATRLRAVLPLGLHGVTCLARGSDQIFARAVADLGGTFEVVLPAHDYRERVVEPDNRDSFDELLGLATAIRTLPYPRSSRIAYFAASEYMLGRCDILLAVWDGSPSRNIGDAAHVVSTARDLGVPVEVHWPAQGTGRPGSAGVLSHR